MPPYVYVVATFWCTANCLHEDISGRSFLFLVLLSLKPRNAMSRENLPSQRGEGRKKNGVTPTGFNWHIRADSRGKEVAHLTRGGC